MKEIEDFFRKNGFVLNKNKIDISQKNSDGDTPLRLAAKQNKFVLASRILCYSQEKLSKEIKKTGEHSIVSAHQFNDGVVKEKVQEKETQRGTLLFGSFQEKLGTKDMNLNCHSRKPNENNLGKTKQHGIDILQNLLNEFDKNKIQGVMTDPSWFEKYKVDFEKWVFQVNADLKLDREKVLQNDEFLPFKPKKFITELSIFLKCKELRDTFFKEQNRFEALLKVKFILDRVEELVIGTMDKKLKLEEANYTSEEDIENQIILNITCIQMLGFIAKNIIETNPIINSINKALIVDLNIFVKECETHLIETQKNLEKELTINIQRQIELEKTVSYLNDFELQLSVYHQKSHDLLKECSTLKTEAQRKQSRENDYMMSLLKRIRLGLTPRQQEELLLKTETELLEYKHRQNKLLTTNNIPEDFKVQFQKQDMEFVKKNKDLIRVWSRKAYSAGEELFCGLLNYRKQAIDEQFIFLYEQTRFIKSFCKDNNIDYQYTKIDRAYLKGAPILFTIINRFPNQLGFKKFRRSIEVRKIEIEKFMEEKRSQLAALKNKIEHISHETIEVDNELQVIRNQLLKVQSEKSSIVNEKDLLKNRMLNQIPKYFDQTQLPSSDDQFGDLYLINDTIIDSRVTRQEEIRFSTESVNDDLKSFIQFDEHINANSARFALMDLGNSKKKIEEELKLSHEEVVKNEAKIKELEDVYFDNQSKIEDLEYQLLELQERRNYLIDDQDVLLAQKDQHEKELELINKEYFHLYWINQKILGQNSLLNALGTSFSCANDEEDFNPKVKAQAAIVVEDICMAIAGCASDTFNELWNEKPEIMEDNIKKLPIEIEKAGKWFLEQIIYNFKQAEYEQSYIEIHSKFLEKLWTDLKAPCDEIPNRIKQQRVLS